MKYYSNLLNDKKRFFLVIGSVSSRFDIMEVEKSYFMNYDSAHLNVVVKSNFWLRFALMGKRKARLLALESLDDPNSTAWDVEVGIKYINLDWASKKYTITCSLTEESMKNNAVYNRHYLNEMTNNEVMKS